MMYALLAMLGMASPQPAERMWTGRAAGTPVRVVSVDLTDPRVQVRVQLARGAPHGAESMSTLVARTRPTAAINGAYASKATLAPIGDIVIGGRQVYTGLMGTVLAITKDNSAAIRRVPYGRHQNWSGYETVLGCGPALVLDGEVDVQPEAEHFGRDRHIMVPTRRVGVGLTLDGRLLMVATLAPVGWKQWARVMRALNCQDAMNLDAGASMGFYYHGKAVISPSRHITNILAVFVNKQPPSIALLVPGGRRTAMHASWPSVPGNASGANTVETTLCADSGEAASTWCPITVRRRVPRARHLRPCPLHHAPQVG